MHQNFAQRIQTYLRNKTSEHAKNKKRKNTKTKDDDDNNDDDDDSEEETTTKQSHVEVEFLMLDLTDLNTFLQQLDQSLVRVQQAVTSLDTVLSSEKEPTLQQKLEQQHAQLQQQLQSLRHTGNSKRGDDTQQQKPNGHTILRIPYLNPEGHGGVQHANTESTQRCNFPMTSQFIKVLQPSLVVYRNLTMSVWSNAMQCYPIIHYVQPE